MAVSRDGALAARRQEEAPAGHPPRPGSCSGAVAGQNQQRRFRLTTSWARTTAPIHTHDLVGRGCPEAHRKISLTLLREYKGRNKKADTPQSQTRKLLAFPGVRRSFTGCNYVAQSAVNQFHAKLYSFIIATPVDALYAFRLARASGHVQTLSWRFLTVING